jgi:hypothetical protein
MDIRAIEKLDKLNASGLLEINHKGMWTCLDSRMRQGSKKAVIAVSSRTSRKHSR